MTHDITHLLKENDITHPLKETSRGRQTQHLQKAKVDSLPPNTSLKTETPEWIILLI